MGGPWSADKDWRRRLNRHVGDFAGIPVSRTSLPQAVDELLVHAKRHTQPMAYRLVNSYTFALADQLRSYHDLLRDRGINLPDGRPLVHSLNRLIPGPGDFRQVRGPTLFAHCLDQGRSLGVRHFFLGGTEELLNALVREATSLYPGIAICGTHSPPFREMTQAEIEEQDQLIRNARPDVVWVGLGTPKQDFEAQRLCDELGVTTAGVGAAFDFIAGTKREAPVWMRQVSMEWAFRLVTEPRRLWRRYLFGNSRFIRLAVRQWGRPSLGRGSGRKPDGIG